jgi:hypothetical protein
LFSISSCPHLMRASSRLKEYGRVKHGHDENLKVCARQKN